MQLLQNNSTLKQQEGSENYRAYLLYHHFKVTEQIAQEESKAPIAKGVSRVL
jgi:hypothetical protein